LAKSRNQEPQQWHCSIYPLVHATSAACRSFRSPRRPAVQRPEHQHVGRLPRQDGGDGLADHGAGGDAARAGVTEVRELGQPEGVDQVVVVHQVHVAAHDAVDLGGGDAGVVKRGGRGLDALFGLIGGVLGGLGGMSGFMPAIWTQLRGWRRDLRRATM